MVSYPAIPVSQPFQNEKNAFPTTETVQTFPTFLRSNIYTPCPSCFVNRIFFPSLSRSQTKNFGGPLTCQHDIISFCKSHISFAIFAILSSWPDSDFCSSQNSPFPAYFWVRIRWNQTEINRCCSSAHSSHVQASLTHTSKGEKIHKR